MPKITPGNHLFFYQLFSTELGKGKQTPIQRIDEVLAEADVLLDDVDCASIDELLAALADFMKVTTFKKGRVFVTVMASPELDDLLAKAAQPAPEAAPTQTGMAWKRSRRSKTVKPIKPRHKRVVKAAQPVVEETIEEMAASLPVVEMNLEPVEEKGAAEETAETTSETEAANEATQPSAAEATSESVELGEAASPEPVVDEQPAEPEPVAEEGMAQEVPEPALEQPSEPEQALEANPDPAPEQLEAPAEPSISFNITYAPEPSDDADVDEQNAPEEEPAPEPVAPPTPRPKHIPAHAMRLPEVISEEVFCPSELLLKVYRALPPTVGIMETFDESWEFAQQAGTIDGTRTRLTFPLSRVIEGNTPIEITIARATRLASGKQWKLVAVDTGEDDEPESADSEA